jgi:hypothetical protein
VLSWEQLDQLWQTLASMADDAWYVYTIGETPPTEPFTAARFRHFLDEINTLLVLEHQEDYCGIVYADDLDNPSFVKVFDPNNLGVVCGYSDNPPLPGWTISRIPPQDLLAPAPLPGGRKRWWRRILGAADS